VRGVRGISLIWAGGDVGISYPGFYAACALLDAHPALKAVSPQAPLVDWFLGDDTHHNGAFLLQQEFNFDAVYGRPRPQPTAQAPPRFDHGTRDAYAFFLALGPLARADERYFKGQRAFWSAVMRHGTYEDFWKERSLLPHLKDVRPAVLTVGGWFDAEDLFGPLQAHRALERAGPQAENTLVMGLKKHSTGNTWCSERWSWCKATFSPRPGRPGKSSRWPAGRQRKWPESWASASTPFTSPRRACSADCARKLTACWTSEISERDWQRPAHIYQGVAAPRLLGVCSCHLPQSVPARRNCSASCWGSRRPWMPTRWNSTWSSASTASSRCKRWTCQTACCKPPVWSLPGPRC
jgi:hypothetical protein